MQDRRLALVTHQQVQSLKVFAWTAPQLIMAMVQPLIIMPVNAKLLINGYGIRKSILVLVDVTLRLKYILEQMAALAVNPYYTQQEPPETINVFVRLTLFGILLH
jgi:hypothetical protein